MTRQETGDRTQETGADARARSHGACSERLPFNLQPSTFNSPRGFTLVELLVAVTILLILSVITFAMVNATLKGDQIRGAARQMQSYLEGARDRAIHAKEPRGVRLLLDQNNANTVTSMVFIGAPGTYSEGSFTIRDDKRTIEPSTLTNLWLEMVERGLLGDGQPIEIANNFYTISRASIESPVGSGTYVDSWQLTRDFTGSGMGPWTIDGSASNGYTLQLNPAVLPNQEPRLLPSGIVIDLPHSKLPSFWGSSGSYVSQMDVLFSPRGTVIGLIGSAGNIHLLLADVKDFERGIGAVDVDLSDANTTLDEHEIAVGDRLVVTITTQTGKISTHPVNPDPTLPLDPWRFAELGEEAK